LRTVRLYALFLCCFLLMIALAPSAQSQRKRQIAVLDFDFATVDIGLARRAYGGAKNLSRQISDKLVTRLTGLGTCQVIERSQLERIIREQRLGSLGHIDPNTMAKAGKVLGVDSLVIGNVAVFDLKGLPQPRETNWDPSRMSARIVASFRVIDTTTALVEMSKEGSGSSAPPQKRSGKSRFWEELLKDNRRQPAPKVTDEQLKSVVEEAVDELVSNISTELDNHFSNARQRAEEQPAPANVLAGRVIRANGPTVYIVDLNRSQVRRGDRLYVRRGIVDRDPVTGKEYKFTEKIGEVEIVEIQDELVVGSFTGSIQVQPGDIVTNSENGAGISSLVRTYTPAQGMSGQEPSRNPASTPDQRGGTVPRPRGGAPGAPTQERSFTLDARQGWLQTEISVQPGMSLEIAAQGAINIDRFTRVGPAGASRRTSASSLPLPTAAAGAVIAKIRYQNGRDSNLALIGAGNRVRVDPGEYGMLLVGINDGTLADNAGAFTVTIRW